MTRAQRHAEAAVKAHANTCPHQGASVESRIAWEQRLLELYRAMWSAFDTPQRLRDEITTRHTRIITELDRSTR